MRRALVTGATGGLGIALVDALLNAGYRVRATGRRREAGASLRASGADFIPADLTMPGAVDPLVQGMNVVFHAAALSSPWGQPSVFRRINVEVTRSLLGAARAAGCDGFIFFSTPSVYAEARDRLNLTEKSPLAARFANGYVETKYAAERLVLAADAPGFPAIVLRPRALVGPDDTVLLPRLLRVAAKGRFPLFRNGQAMTELTDVRDAAEAAIAADRFRETVGGRIFNLSGGRPETVADTLAEVFGALGLKPKLTTLPYAPIAAMCGMVEAVCARLPGRPEPPATVYSLGTLAFSQTFDLTAAREDLSWRPRFTPQQAIARTAARWRRHAPV